MKRRPQSMIVLHLIRINDKVKNNKYIMQFFFFGSQFYELTEGFQRRFLERHQICLILNVSEIQAENAQYYV